MKLADLRQEYMRAGLAEADVLADPVAQFERWMQEAVAADLPLANAMTLATVEDGAPDARVVLLKGVEDGAFVFYTNYLSRKGRQLAARPLACLVFLWAPLERQVRVEGRVEKVAAAESDAYFASRPAGARVGLRLRAERGGGLARGARGRGRAREARARRPSAAPRALGRLPRRALARGILAGPREPPARPPALPPARRRLDP